MHVCGFDVVEDTWSEIDIQAGGAWLWTTNSGNIIIKSCDGIDIVDVKPVHPG